MPDKKDAQTAYFGQLKDGGGPCWAPRISAAYLRTLLFGLGATVAIGFTGCQSDVGGQTLPSPYYLDDDVQYFRARAADAACAGSGGTESL